MVPGSLVPLRYLPLRLLVPVPSGWGPVWSRGFLYLSKLGPQCPSVVLHRRPSLGYGPTRSLSLLRLFGPFLGVLLSAPSSFSTSGLLSARPFGLSLFFSAGSELLPSLPVRSVGFSSGCTALASLRGQGSSSPGCPCSVPSGCLCSAPFLPLLFLRCLCGLVFVFSPG